MSGMAPSYVSVMHVRTVTTGTTSTHVDMCTDGSSPPSMDQWDAVLACSSSPGHHRSRDRTQDDNLKRDRTRDDILTLLIF